MYVYIKSEPGLYTVGFYEPGIEPIRFISESDHLTKESAAMRVSYLNGGKLDPRQDPVTLD